MTMTPQERDVIAGIFDRLKQAANQPRDPEAEAFIAERLREQPYAPYAMAQSVYVQEQALQNLQAQVDDLQAKLRALEERQAEAPAPSGGFLSGIFGGAPQAPRPRSVPSFPPRTEQAPSPAWNTQPQAAPMQAAPPPGMQAAAPGPWGGQAAQSAARGGGFMASALTTAAGVAGGMVVGNMLMNAFSGSHGAAQAAGTAAASGTSSLADSVTAGNVADTAQPASSGWGSGNTDYNDGSSDPANYQQAADDTPVEDDDPGFGGDDDSWV
ncbi:MAG: DUF2076 domain-containing protein [Chelatococcus sp.]|nr:MAG: DUF2076 domain-containing protein [Chelatococcus sp.]